ncbi:hypothetical protein ACIBF5_29515 [Micromonospora sp. NPDC050417]|uniref:hypothetical protein n=1 Tax=Micromonospora sp. NPDC050417 TaxID=3364280 RepID=UPI0037AA15CB
MSDQSVSVVHFGVGDDGEAAEAVAETLRSHGFTARALKAQANRGDASNLALIVLLAVPVHSFLSALGESLGSATGEAMHALFGRILTRLGSGRSERPVVVIRDATRGIDAEISAGLPPEAFEKLSELATEDSVKLRYDPVAGAWVAVGR